MDLDRYAKDRMVCIRFLFTGKNECLNFIRYFFDGLKRSNYTVLQVQQK